MKSSYRQKLSEFSLKIWGMFLGACALQVDSIAQESLVQRENAIKAGFLVGMQEFVTWETETETSKTVIYAIIGDESFEEILRRAISAKKDKNKNFSVKTFESIEDVSFVNFLFVRDIPEDKIRELIKKCEGLGILTVSDQEGFVERGGIVEFFRSNNRVRLKINVNAAKRSKIKFSSKLMRLAERVKR